MNVLIYECPEAPADLRYIGKGVCTTEEERAFTRRMGKPTEADGVMMLPTWTVHATPEECAASLERFAAEIAAAAEEGRKCRAAAKKNKPAGAAVDEPEEAF
jgi:hypothetical protein